MGSDAAECVNKEKDQVRSRQKNVERSRYSLRAFNNLVNVHGGDDECGDIHGKEFLNYSKFHHEFQRSQQMFDISAKLVGEQDEISGLETIGLEKHSWRQLSLIGDETVINLQRAKVYVFSDSVLCLGRIHQHPESNEAWKKRIEGITTNQSYRDYDAINGEPTEFEWNIFPGFTTLQLCGKVNDLLSRLGEKPETFKGRILFMSMFNDISCERRGNKEECLVNARVVKVFAKNLVLVNGHLLVQVLKRSGILGRE